MLTWFLAAVAYALMGWSLQAVAQQGYVANNRPPLSVPVRVLVAALWWLVLPLAALAASTAASRRAS